MEQICSKWGWQMSWMDEEKRRRETASSDKLARRGEDAAGDGEERHCGKEERAFFLGVLASIYFRVSYVFVLCFEFNDV